MKEVEALGLPYRGGVGEEGRDEGFVCENKSLLALSPRGTSKGPQDVRTGGSTRDKGRYVGGESEAAAKLLDVKG